MDTHMTYKKQFNSLEELVKEDIFFYFSEISKIPRSSGKEEQISEYLLNWAKELGLSAVRDEYLNVIIKKPAAAGYEESEPVMLQAHMDMVCEKTPDSTHDFTKDPISLVLDGDLIKSNGETTLGADNGMGVAYIMAVLASKDIPHPKIEALLTADEEYGFTGIHGVSPLHFSAKRMINLDHAVCDEILAGGCGGYGVHLRIPAIFEPAEKDYKAFKLVLSDMHGGHSGEDIHRGFGNAISLIFRALYSCRSLDVRVSAFWGGTIRTAIPRDAGVLIFVKNKDIEELKSKATEILSIFKEEYGCVAPDLDLRLIELSCEEAPRNWLTHESCLKTIQAAYLFPNSIQQMNNLLAGVVESSCNLGMIEMEEDNILLTGEIRAAFNSTCSDIQDKLVMLGDVLGGTVDFFTHYAPWTYNPDSPLREKALYVYQREFNEPFRTVVVHAGIECGMLLGSMPYLDTISIGPDCWFFHSVKECVSVSGALKTWHLLKTLLAELKD